MVKVRLNSVPPKTGSFKTCNFMLGFSCAAHTRFSSDALFCLPAIQGIQWPDISWARPVSGDDGPLAWLHPTDDIIHSGDDGDFGQTHHCILKVLCFLQCLHKSRSISSVSFPHTLNILIMLICVPYSLPSRASSLVTSERGKQTPRSSTSSTSVRCLMVTNKHENNQI